MSYSIFSLIKNKNSSAQRLNPLRLKKYRKVEVRRACQKIQSALCKSLFELKGKSFCTFFLLTKLKKEFKCESRGTFVAHFNTQWANILLEGASLINSTEWSGLQANDFLGWRKMFPLI